MSIKSLYLKIINNPRAAGLITSLILFLLGVPIQLLDARFATQNEFLTGEYYGYYFLRDGDTLVSMDVSITEGYFRSLNISTKELNAAAYAYTGAVTVLDGILYSQLKGNRSDDLLFIVLRLPFNKGKQLPAINGVFMGLTQAKEPASTKVILSRTPLSDLQVRENLGDKPWTTITAEWPKAMQQLVASPDSRL